MMKLVALTALSTGVLLLLVPRYILPACEYEGFARMHCSDTARAEFIVGAFLVLVGGMTLFARTVKPLIIAVLVSSILYGIAFRLPDVYGYCLSPRMPCNYGMVPAVRFIAVFGALVMVVALFRLVKYFKTKGNT
jgi:uncharacterized protein DUF4418